MYMNIDANWKYKFTSLWRVMCRASFRSIVEVPGVLVHTVEGHSTGLYRSYLQKKTQCRRFGADGQSGEMVSALDCNKSGVAHGVEV